MKNKKVTFSVEVDDSVPEIKKFELDDSDLQDVNGGENSYEFVESQRESMIVQYGLTPEQAELFRSVPSYDLMQVLLAITLACALNHNNEYTVAEIIEECCKAYFNNK